MNRESKTKAWLAKRARVGEAKTIRYKIMDTPDVRKNWGLPETGEVTFTNDGGCPCSACGHEFMWECDEANCQCCSSVCT